MTKPGLRIEMRSPREAADVIRISLSRMPMQFYLQGMAEWWTGDAVGDLMDRLFAPRIKEWRLHPFRQVAHYLDADVEASLT